MESGGGFTCKISGGVDADLPIVARNSGISVLTGSSEGGQTPRPEVEIPLSNPSCGRFGRSLSRLTLEKESTIRIEGTLENLPSSMRCRFSSPLSRSVSTEMVVACLALYQGRKEVSPLNIGNGVVR